MLATERKRRGANAKNKLAEIDKPRGFERNLSLAAIVGATTDPKNGNRLMFLLQWAGCDELDLVPASEVNEHCSEDVIRYYEARSPLVLECERRRRVCEQAADDLLAYPPDEAPVVEPSTLAVTPTSSPASPSPSPSPQHTDGKSMQLDIELGGEPSETTTPTSEMDTSVTAAASEPDASADDTSMSRSATGGMDTPTLDEEIQNDSFLAEVASEAAEHQARTEALPEDIEMPNVTF